VVELALSLAVLPLLAAASMVFAQRPARPGRGARLFLTSTAWICWLGAVAGWLLVLVQLVTGPGISPANPLVVAVAFGLAAPPTASMARALAAGAGEGEGRG